MLPNPHNMLFLFNTLKLVLVFTDYQQLPKCWFNMIADRSPRFYEQNQVKAKHLQISNPSLTKILEWVPNFT